MSAIDFPNSPALNALFNASGKTWRWDGTAWLLINSFFEVNIEPTATAIDGGVPSTIQFLNLGAVDGGGVS
jgi:hypothetical protein